MLIKQLSVFLEDRSGRLTELTRILAENDVNITALTVAETADYGMVRMVVGRPERAKNALENAGFTVGLTEVACVKMPDQPGSLHQILQILTAEQINVDYMYAFSNSNVALAVIRSTDISRVAGVLQQHQLELLSESDLYQL